MENDETVGRNNRFGNHKYSMDIEGLKSDNGNVNKEKQKENGSQEHRPEIVLLVETHLDEENAKLCLKKFGNGWEGIIVPGDGRSRGMVLAWRSICVEVSLVYKCSQTIHAVVRSSRGKLWLLTGVYASNDAKERMVLWQFLMSLNIENIPWMVISDFNCVVEELDKKGGKNLQWKIEKMLKNVHNELEILERIDENGDACDLVTDKIRCLSNKAIALNKQIHIKWWAKAREK
ncbi:hypothetical protein Cni_G00884 [Canna indica]|uniref:Uncharacterized protein n=1 Tax=Canna indica TaxID=4628 RepID=A0AAQ3JLS9_9LILI|nr:hypothetical protein Cni_G00884 [Canna indica]